MSFLGALTSAAGMSTAKWMTLPVVQLCVAELTPTQEISGELWHSRRPSDVACRDPYVHAVRVGKVLYIEDGHHRWARARRDHEWFILGRVLEL